MYSKEQKQAFSDFSTAPAYSDDPEMSSARRFLQWAVETCRVELGDTPNDVLAAYAVEREVFDRLREHFAGKARLTAVDEAAPAYSERTLTTGSRKLSPADVAEIRGALASGAGAQDLARQYSVTEQSIRNIAKGNTWRLVGAPAAAESATKSGAKPGRMTITSAVVGQVTDLLNHGVPRPVIEKMTGLSQSAVRTLARGLHPLQNGGAAYRTVTAETVASIESLLLDGETVADIARKLAVSTRTVESVQTKSHPLQKRQTKSTANGSSRMNTRSSH